ncbi:Hsp33 family molecular chaperone HslO [Mycoplasma sp. P36-A1]|uniref:Hsp33 family molecular chaperone HslO n=1 Tax=Mycoplasma sp. P36-A1 TaxID=3252900 RepID=UPI003C2E8FCE
MNSVAIRGIALENRVRILAINSTSLIYNVTNKLETTAVASAALGRSMSITSLMGLMKKNEDQIFTTIDGKGALGAIHVHYMGHGKIRGYVDNPNVQTFINDMNKLDVSRAVGTDGFLTVKYRQGLKADYLGSVPIQSGEISQDYTYYFASSEQTPSVVSAGVLVDSEEKVSSSGAIIIQLMPGYLEEDIVFIENHLNDISNLSSKLEVENDIERLIKNIFKDFEVLESKVIEYDCACSYEEMESKIMTLSLKDLIEIRDEDKMIEAVCPWCNEKYIFDEVALNKMIDERVNKMVIRDEK